jgi:hypothetical protein
MVTSIEPGIHMKAVLFETILEPNINAATAKSFLFKFLKMFKAKGTARERSV